MLKKLGIAGWGLIMMVAALIYFFFKDEAGDGYLQELRILGITAVIIILFVLFYKFIQND